MPLPPGYEWNLEYSDYGPMGGFREPTRDEIQQDKEQFDPTANWDYQNQAKQGPQGQTLPEGAVGWRPTGDIDWGAGLGGWWRKTMYNVGSAYQTGYEEGLQISGFGKSVISTQTIGKGKATTEAEAQKVQGAVEQAQAERKPENETQAKIYGVAEALKASFNATLGGVLEGLGSSAVATEQVLGAAGYSLADVAQGQDVDFKQNFEAGRLAYAGVFDASIREEMNRRLEAGERGDLAAEKIMIDKPWTLWPQLIGQVIYDPLNVVSAFGKAGEAIKMEKSVVKEFHTIANPVVREAVENAGELTKMDDATAYGKLDDLVKSQQGLLATAAHADDISQASGRLEELSHSYKMASLTADGKVSHLANQTSEIMMHVVNNSDPEEAIEIFRGIVKSVSHDPTEAAEGVASMLKFKDAPALFSEAGNNTTVVLGRMSEKYGDDWLKNLDAFKDDPTGLTKDLLGKLDEVGGEMFPSVSKMLAAEDKVKAGGEITEATRKLAERAKELPNYVKQATRFHDKAQTVVGPINKFFAGAYMGWSPGYAFRNWSNNTLQMFIDYGPGVLMGKADDVFAKAEQLHGGVIMGAHGFGAEVASLFPEKVAEGATDVKAALQAVKAKGLKGPALGLAETMERNAAKRVIAKTYTQTFERGVKAMTKALSEPLKAAGFSDDVIAKLPTYIMQHQGDSAAVVNALRKDVASGVIDIFNDIDRIDPKYKSFLSSAGKWDEYAEKVLQASTKEEATAAAQKIFDDLAQTSGYAYRDGRAANTVDGQFLKMIEKDGMPQTRGELFDIRKTQNRSSVQISQEILKEADDLGAKLGLDVGSMKSTRGIFELEGWGNKAAKESDRLSTLLWKIIDESHGKGADLKGMWAKYSDFFQGVPPEEMTARAFRDALMEGFDGAGAKNWGSARDTAVEGVRGFLDDLKAAGAPVKPEWYQAMDESADGARQWDNVVIGKGGAKYAETTPIPGGTRATQISQIAQKYGISSATEKGVATDKKILGIINKYGDTNFKSLSEPIDLQLVEDAFKKKAKVPPVEIPPKTGGIEIAEATSVPRSELPEQVSQRFADEAKRLANELAGGEAGKRTAEGVTGTTNASWYRELYNKGLRKPEIDKALDKIIMDAGADKGKGVERMKELILDNFKFGDKASGTPPDLYALSQLGADDKTMAEALDNFNDITGGNASLEDAIKSSTPGATTEEAGAALHDPDMPYYDDAGNLVEPQRKPLMPPPVDGEAPTISRAIHEQMEDVTKMRKWVMDDIAGNYGKKQVVDKVAEKGLQTLEKELTSKIAETRLISSRVAQANRDFTLLNYGEKSYWDVALSYVYPYHFWYKGTYKNWMKRLVSNPSILAHYNRYKENLGTVHAGMPEWWRYNINTNDLPGVDVENPFYFNAEATLWPLNGLTGTDFNDPSKRVNWWTSTLDYANKFGPSTWAPINILTGLALYAKGEKEAGEKWMGRLIPQSATIKAGASLLGVANLETDPFVKFLQGGLDPYERRRVQRALAEMEQDTINGNLPYTREQIQDAAYSQEGEIWDEAVKRAVNGRSQSQLSSFFLGVGFKGRTTEDMQIDKFYTDYNKLWTMRPNITPEEFKQGMNKLKDSYPFMDTVLLARRDDVNRDSGLAYMVLQRIPPGKTSEIAKAVDIDPALLDKFFADKGQIDKWQPSDRLKFMAGVMNISAVLEIPGDMTRAEWNKAKSAYSQLSTEAKGKFGDDILDSVDGYYQAKTNSPQAADAYLDKHPEVSDYMNWRAERIMGSDLLSAYYGGASMVEGYYRSKMYADIESKLGKEIFSTLDEYNDLKTYGTSAEQKSFYSKHKVEIRQYYNMKDAWNVTIDQNVAKLSAYMPEGEGATVREDYDSTSPTQSALASAVQPEQQPTYEDFQAVMPERLLNLIQDYYNNGDRLPESAEKQLARLANDMGYPDASTLLQAVGTSLYENTP